MNSLTVDSPMNSLTPCPASADARCKCVGLTHTHTLSLLANRATDHVPA